LGTGAHPEERFWWSKPFLLEVKAMFLMADIVRELLLVARFTLVQINNSDQTLKKSSKISYFCLPPLSEPPSLKISGCIPVWASKFIKTD